MTKLSDHAARMAQERLDVLEEPWELPTERGCSARYNGVRCGKRVVRRSGKRLCAECRDRYAVHDAIVARIRAIPNRATLGKR
jgi:hypothetical protein